MWFLFSSGGITVGRVLEPEARLTRTKELPTHSQMMEARVGMGVRKPICLHKNVRVYVRTPKQTRR